jgi:PAS domain S-box-containing protein
MTTKIKILIVEDDKNDIELLQHELETGGINYVSEIVQTEKGYREALLKFIPDIILSDYTLPAFAGAAAFKIKEELAPDTPFIFVTGTIGEEKSIELIKSGVTDYTLKGRLFTLIVKLKRALKDAEVKQQNKLAEEQKEFDKRNLDALINNTEDLMWSIDKDFNLITSNKPFDDAMKLLTGNSIAKGSNMLVSEFLPERLNRYKVFCQRAFAGEVFTEVEHRETPVEVWSEISYYPVRIGNEVLGTACHSRDITERKKIELILERQNKNLLKANSELDGFVYSTTHDLRSPLTSMLGLARLIEEESKELNTLDHVKMIRTSINRLDDFIKDLLNYSQNTHSELIVETIAVQKLTQDIVHSLHNIPGAKGINFKVDIDEQQPFYSDRRRFSTVLENLISNAIKYHKQDITGRYIKVTGKSDKENLNLSIQDNGIGIAEVNHDKIFKMFFRLPSKVTGSGFGLYIVKETIEKLQGFLRVDSKEGIGTSFTICIKNHFALLNDPGKRELCIL